MKNTLLIIAIILGQQLAAQVSPIPIHVEGNIVTADTSINVKGALVELYFENKLIDSITTQVDGYFNFPMVMLGDYTLITKKYGFDNDTIGPLVADYMDDNIVGARYQGNIVIDTLPVIERYAAKIIKSKRLQVYPNPTYGKVRLEKLPITDEIKLIDITGNILKTIPINLQQSLEIDLSSFPPGFYFLTYIEHGQRQSKKLVKQ